MGFKSVRDPLSAAASNWTFSMSAFYATQDHPAHFRRGSDWPLRPELDALLNVRLLSQLNERVGGSSCLLLSGRVAVLGCCIGSFVVLSAYAAELRITSVFSCVAHSFKARHSFMFAGCRWRRSLAVDGGPGDTSGTRLCWPVVAGL
jgi:hypothetical protein